jgi:hypothetical protein
MDQCLNLTSDTTQARLKSRAELKWAELLLCQQCYDLSPSLAKITLLPFCARSLGPNLSLDAERQNAGEASTNVGAITAKA